MYRRPAFGHSQLNAKKNETTPAEPMTHALRDGDRAAWRAWITQYSPLLYSYVLYNTHAEVDAQQLLQSALTLATKTFLQSEASTELTVLAVSTVYQAVTRYQQRCGAPLWGATLGAVSPSPSGSEPQTHFLQLLDNLALVERHIVLLRYVVGLSFAEIEAVTEQPIALIVEMMQKVKRHFGSLLPPDA